MKIEQGTFCPLIKGECIQFKCMFFTQLRGADPQTGKEIDEWDCAIKWLPVLLIEGAKETRQGAAAIESFRNEMVRSQTEYITTVEQTIKQLQSNDQNDNIKVDIEIKEITNEPNNHS